MFRVGRGLVMGQSPQQGVLPYRLNRVLNIHLSLQNYIYIYIYIYMHTHMQARTHTRIEYWIDVQILTVR
jgi:hypothetical protein